MKKVVYLPEITISNLKDYAQKSQSQKGFIEGMNLHNFVEFNNINSDCAYKVTSMFYNMLLFVIILFPGYAWNLMRT
jgi:hypothetical protein